MVHEHRNTENGLFADLSEQFKKKSVEWIIWDGLTDYQQSLSFMENRVAEIRAGTANEAVLLLEHPPLYTAGTSAKGEDLLEKERFPVFETGRGGQYTYHGPGQRVAYVMLDLQKRGLGVREYVKMLEAWIIDTLSTFNIRGEIRPERVGVWVQRPEKGLNAEDKIAAIGVRIRRGVSFHGIAVNVQPDLSHFGGIIPCGLSGYGVTSFEDLGYILSMEEVDIALKQSFFKVFTPLF